MSGGEAEMKKEERAGVVDYALNAIFPDIVLPEERAVYDRKSGDISVVVAYGLVVLPADDLEQCGEGEKPLLDLLERRVDEAAKRTHLEFRTHVFRNSAPLHQPSSGPDPVAVEKAKIANERGMRTGAVPSLRLVLNLARDMISHIDAGAHPGIPISGFLCMLQSYNHMRMFWPDESETEKAREVVRECMEMVGELSTNVELGQWSMGFSAEQGARWGYPRRKVDRMPDWKAAYWDQAEASAKDVASEAK